MKVNVKLYAQNIKKDFMITVYDAENSLIPFKEGKAYTAHIDARSFMILAKSTEILKEEVVIKTNFAKIYINIISVSNTSAFVFPFTVTKVENTINIHVLGQNIPENLKQIPVIQDPKYINDIVDENNHLKNEIKQYWIKKLHDMKLKGNEIFITTETAWEELFVDDNVRSLHLVNISYEGGKYYIGNQSGWFFRYIQEFEFNEILAAITHKQRDFKCTNPNCISIPIHPEQHFNGKLYFTNLMTDYSDEAKQFLQLPSSPLYRIDFMIDNKTEVAFGEVDEFVSDLVIYIDKYAERYESHIDGDAYYWQFIYCGKGLSVQIDSDCLDRLNTLKRGHV